MTNVSLIQYLIICPLAMLAGFVDAIVGGGGLISLPAYLIAGIPVHYAIGTNHINGCMSSLIATVKYGKDKYISWKEALYCAVSAILGAAAGAYIALKIDEKFFTYMMLVILPLTGIYIIFGRTFSEEKKPYAPTVTAIIAIIVSFAMGAYDGFYGPGSGTFMLLLLIEAAHMSSKRANGICKVVFSVTNITAFIVFLQNGKLILMLGIAAGVCSSVGGYLGARFFEKANPKVLKGLVLFVLVIFMIKIITGLL